MRESNPQTVGFEPTRYSNSRQPAKVGSCLKSPIRHDYLRALARALAALRRFAAAALVRRLLAALLRTVAFLRALSALWRLLTARICADEVVTVGVRVLLPLPITPPTRRT